MNNLTEKYTEPKNLHINDETVVTFEEDEKKKTSFTGK